MTMYLFQFLAATNLYRWIFFLIPRKIVTMIFYYSNIFIFWFSSPPFSFFSLTGFCLVNRTISLGLATLSTNFWPNLKIHTESKTLFSNCSTYYNQYQYRHLLCVTINVLLSWAEGLKVHNEMPVIIQKIKIKHILTSNNGRTLFFSTLKVMVLGWMEKRCSEYKI